MMSTHRSIRLDVGTSNNLQRDSLNQEQSFSQTRSDADSQTQQRFEEAMQQKASDRQETSANLPSPFSLFGAPVATQTVTTEALSNSISQVEQAIEGLMVSDQDGKHRVRIALKEDVLPGVSVNVFEADGRLVVEFCCEQEQSYQLLLKQQSELVQELANRLRKEVLMRVCDERVTPASVEEKIAFEKNS